MKIVAWIVAILFLILGGIYFIAFTSTGNGILKPIINEKIDEATKLKTNLKLFKITSSEFEIFLELDSENTVYAKGTYSLMTQAFDASYKVELHKLENLKELTGQQLVGALNTEGTAKGDMAYVEIDGVSDVGLSDTDYHIELTDMNPTSIIAKVKNADLETLLKLGGQKAYAKAKIDVNINFKDITPHQLDGDIVLVTRKGILNTPLMNKDFELKIPKTNFSMNLDATLKGDSVDYTYALKSNLAKITSNGNIIPQPLKTNIKYALNVKELAVLKPITNADVRGAFNLHGTIKGTQEKMAINGISDFASSDTTFTAILKNMQADSLKANMKNLKLAKVLYMVKQPHYSDGVFDLSINMTNLKEGELQGSVVSNVKNGLLDSKYLTKAYEFKSKMPQTKFSLSTNSIISKNIIDTSVHLNSTLADFDIEKVQFNLLDKSIKSDFKATLHNLDKLYFVTERHLKGAMKVTGDVAQAKDLDITTHMNFAGGTIDTKLHNDDLHADIKSIQTIDTLTMLIYPTIFKSSLNGVLEYNLKAQKGVFKGNLSDGEFTKNMAFTLVKQYAQIDMYKQKFAGTVNADINKEHILASLDLTSNTSSIKTTNTKLNSKTKSINSKIEIVANKHPVSVLITGKTDAPKVKVDAEGIVKDQVKKEITKRLEEQLGKEAGGKLGGLLKGFF